MYIEYCDEMLADKAKCTKLQDFWKAQVEKFGLTKRQLSHMLSQHETYKQLAAEPKLCRTRRFARNKERGLEELEDKFLSKISSPGEDMARS